uniref:Spen paralogue and orthologue SPOC C-terminal domain-containing protein n=1 Tax=Anguilla anguilla TaxID=7936 RepID=A0A0E9XWI2_ANGAN
MFLARLQSMWKGFINMPSVAKFVTKAYPVSGILDHLTEDLPDSIQVGGRISPHTVWDYVEKFEPQEQKYISCDFYFILSSFSYKHYILLSIG